MFGKHKNLPFLLVVLMAVSVAGFAVRTEYLVDQSLIYDLGDSRTVKCDGKTSIENGGENVFKFVCDGETLVAEMFDPETYKNLDILAKNMNTDMFNLIIVQVYIGEGKWAMVELWAENLQTDFPGRCQEHDYESVGECPNHINVWTRYNINPPILIDVGNA